MHLPVLLFTAVLTVQQVFSFTLPTAAILRQRSSSSSCSQLHERKNSLDIVLFGAGDLRTTDHAGLETALSNGGKILPLCILDTEDTLPNIPMGRSHTFDTAAMLSSSLESLNGKLTLINQELSLHVKTGAQGQRFSDLLNDIVEEIKIQFPDVEHVTIHACDLGEVDNQLGYGTLSHLRDYQDDGFVSFNRWNCHLRSKAWEDVLSSPSSFPSTFLDYEKKYCLNVEKDATKGTEISTNARAEALKIDSINKVPSVEEISKLLCSAFDYNLNDEDTRGKLERDCNTGIFATHWGGLDTKSTFTEDHVLEATAIFLGKDSNNDGDEALVERLKWWSGIESKLTRNKLSLEHSALNWMMTGGSDGSSASSFGSVKTKSLIEGELLTRYLAAPLLFGLVSPRCILQKANEVEASKETTLFDNIVPTLLKNKNSIGAARTLVEAREWHKLFAYKNKLLHNGKEDHLSVGYWRWHGFLCRYVGCVINKRSEDSKSIEKEGIALVHGFGASGSQWKKTITELEGTVTGEKEVEALAPDLIGFGQCEKPSLTYTQYLWESYIASFMKDIAIGKQKWNSYTIGGNSIGGYTSMSASADDTVVNNDLDSLVVTCNGADGSRKCKGLVLMNSAGKVFTKEEIESMASENGSTVAEATSNDRIGLSSPPSRQIAKVGGSGLLWYLRPRIQSICKNLYPTNPAAVDDELCSGILRDSLDPGAINVMISGSKLPPPRTANELLGADFGSSKNRGYSTTFKSKYKEGTFDGPVLIAQGQLDPLNDAKGRAEMFGNLRKGIKVDPINAGHCPHDELPLDIAKSISSWLTNNV